MIFDADSVSASIVAGASAVNGIVTTEVVKEMTKDAYRRLKSKISEIWGRGGERALDRVEADPASPDALENLRATIAVVPAEDEAGVLERYQDLLSALASDHVARQAADRVATIRLDVESGGRVRIRSLKGASSIDVRSRSIGDFDFGNIDMESGAPRGK